MGNIIINTMGSTQSLRGCGRSLRCSKISRHPHRGRGHVQPHGRLHPRLHNARPRQTSQAVLDEEQDNYQSAPYSQDRDSQASGTRPMALHTAPPPTLVPTMLTTEHTLGDTELLDGTLTTPSCSDLDTKCHHQLHHQCHHLQG